MSTGRSENLARESHRSVARASLEIHARTAQFVSQQDRTAKTQSGAQERLSPA